MRKGVRGVTKRQTWLSDWTTTKSEELKEQKEEGMMHRELKAPDPSSLTLTSLFQPLGGSECCPFWEWNRHNCPSTAEAVINKGPLLLPACWSLQLNCLSAAIGAAAAATFRSRIFLPSSNPLIFADACHWRILIGSHWQRAWEM